MASKNHYQDQIARATARLGHLQAKELIAKQRRESQARIAAKREELRRRQRVADIVFECGADQLSDIELMDALAHVMRDRSTLSH
ncbi:hypothetical protein [Pseudoxanthomonas putridarboris]|uniref:Relaxasome subunit MobC n=1 Tax=Pseudoxanthomonas putridarboris TaxID=752605 RepID=A0ABU9J204_9GAMM